MSCLCSMMEMYKNLFIYLTKYSAYFVTLFGVLYMFGCNKGKLKNASYLSGVVILVMTAIDLISNYFLKRSLYEIQENFNATIDYVMDSGNNGVNGEQLVSEDKPVVPQIEGPVEVRQGHSGPLKSIKANVGDDGNNVQNPQRDGSKFIFAKNKCKGECCPSIYSCSGGCICTTPEQNSLIQHRGGNHSQETIGR